jgi:hypothetical protein
MLLQLAEMGFSDGSANKELLAELNFDMGAVIERLAGNAAAVCLSAKTRHFSTRECSDPIIQGRQSDP